MTMPFVVIEGLDNTGKSTVVHQLTAQLGLEQPSIAYKTPPPVFADAARVVNRTASTDAHFLFHLAGVRYAEDEIAKLLVDHIVVCDRYYFSTFAYHRASGSRLALTIDDVMVLRPDYAFLLTASENERMRRAKEKSTPEPGDLESKTSNPLLATTEDLLLTMGLSLVDTTSLSVDDVVNVILDIVQTDDRIRGA